jgi:hypothetical protein
MVLHYIMIYAESSNADPLITTGCGNLLTNMVPFKLSFTINSCLHLMQNISKLELCYRKRGGKTVDWKGKGGSARKNWVLSTCAVAWRSLPPSPYPGGWPTCVCIRNGHQSFEMYLPHLCFPTSYLCQLPLALSM